jgi:DNA modification methylase
VKLIHGDSLQMLKTLESESVQCCVTSPPYWGLRDYGVEGQLGLEKTPDEYVQKLVAIFREVKRVLKKDGTLWLNLGDSYAGGGRGGIGNASTLQGGQRNQNESRAEKVSVSKLGDGLKAKDLVGIPWLVAFALRADGWYLRSDIIWAKPNVMPESARDRPTRSHEYVFLLTKSPIYLYNGDAIKEPLSAASAARYKHGFKDKKTGTTKGLRVCGEAQPRGEVVPQVTLKTPTGRSKRSVWIVTTQAFKGAHFATFPPKLIRPCVLAGSRAGDTVLDPFNGAGTTGLVATQLRRKYIGIDINEKYLEMTRTRLNEVQLEMFA